MKLLDPNLMSAYFDFNATEKILKDLKSLGRFRNGQQEYETLNIGHAFVGSTSFTRLLRNHEVQGSPAIDWVLNNLDDVNRLPRVEFVFIAKHASAGDFESRLWLFRGLCEHINPAFVHTLQAGTLPL